MSNLRHEEIPFSAPEINLGWRNFFCNDEFLVHWELPLWICIGPHHLFNIWLFTKIKLSIKFDAYPFVCVDKAFYQDVQHH